MSTGCALTDGSWAVVRLVVADVVVEVEMIVVQ